MRQYMEHGMQKPNLDTSAKENHLHPYLSALEKILSEHLSSTKQELEEEMIKEMKRETAQERNSTEC